MEQLTTMIIRMLFSFLLSTILFLVLSSDYVLANSVPIYQPQPNGSLIPLDDTPIMVQGEKLQFILYGDNQPAKVFVQYLFYNPTAIDQETYLAFPYTPSSHQHIPKIFINDQEFPSTNIELYKNEEFIQQFLINLNSHSIQYVDPISGLKKDNWNEFDFVQEANVVIFKVPFLSKEQVKIELSYEQDYGVNKKPYIQPVHFYQYLLQPAAKWSDFRNLQITVAVPVNHFYSSNFHFEPYKGSFEDWIPLPNEVSQNLNQWKYYQTSFPSLPNENFAFSTMSKEGLLFGFVQKGFYDGLGFFILIMVSTLVVGCVCLLMIRWKRWWVSWLIGPVVSFLIASSFTLVSYSLYILFVPVTMNAEWLGGYGLVLSFLFFILYNFFIYFPILICIVVVKKLRQKVINKKKFKFER
ncbi:hypothetical protein LCL95_04100 [Bacillus timonensis]|nr:hypothetical protein [Bacillus timonensis]